MPEASPPGVHHITALCGDAQENLDFYAGVLGLRRVKTTVNFDDPTTHHLYYGDTRGHPGTVLTFFPWSQAPRGRPGAGMLKSVAFLVPSGSLAAWRSRLADADVSAEEVERFGTSVLQFSDPHGLSLELVATDELREAAPWSEGPVSKEMAVRGLAAPTLPVFSEDRTIELFTDVFGWEQTDTDGDRVRVRASGAGVGTAVDLLVRDRHPSGRMGQGTVHHVAFRAPGADAQTAWQSLLRDRGLQVTDVKDRQYFRSIYFRDPDWTSGILFEIATDGPGFLTDETEPDLGSALKLPDWLEGRRDELAGVLPALRSPVEAPE